VGGLSNFFHRHVAEVHNSNPEFGGKFDQFAVPPTILAVHLAVKDGEDLVLAEIGGLVELDNDFLRQRAMSGKQDQGHGQG
jgi:hypothetical protein